jgi:hypothetical protein
MAREFLYKLVRWSRCLEPESNRHEPLVPRYQGVLSMAAFSMKTVNRSVLIWFSGLGHLHSMQTGYQATRLRCSFYNWMEQLPSKLWVGGSIPSGQQEPETSGSKSRRLHRGGQ